MKRESSPVVLPRLLAALLSALLVATPVHAQQAPAAPLAPSALPEPAPGRVVVVAVSRSGAPATVGTLAHLSEQALLRSGRFLPVPLTDALDLEGARARAAHEETVQRELAAARKAWDELEVRSSANHFAAAARAAEQTDLTRHLPELTRALALRAAALDGDGKGRQALKELQGVLEVDPRVPLSSDFFGPDLLAAADRLRKTVGSGGKARLTVGSAPEGARVYVNGRFQGVTPLVLEGLAADDPYVSLVLPGHTLVQGRAKGGRFEATLPPAPGAVALQAVQAALLEAAHPQEAAQALASFGQVVDATQVLALVVGEGGEGLAVEVARVDVAAGRTVVHRAATLPQGEGLVAAADALLAQVLEDPAPAPVTQAPPPGAGWPRVEPGPVLLGVGAALLAGSVLFGLSALGRSSELQGMPQTSPAAAGVAKAGRRAALTADVLAIGALLSGGAGAWLTFGKGPTPPQDAAPAAQQGGRQ